MSLDMAKVLMLDEDLPHRVPTGTLDDYSVEWPMVDFLFRVVADAASRKMLEACIADLLERTDYFFEDHALVSRALGDTAGDWQQALDGKAR